MYKIVHEEYIPLIVESESTESPVRYISYYKNDTNLLEITVNEKTCLIRRLILQLSETYVIVDEDYSIPVNIDSNIALPSDLTNEELHQVDCDEFKTVIRRNAIEIILSGEKGQQAVLVEKKLLIYFDDLHITNIVILDLPPEDVQHTITELEMQ